MAKIARKSNQNLLNGSQGPEMQFQDLLIRIVFLGRIGAQPLKSINIGQMRKSTKQVARTLSYTFVNLL